MKKLLYRLYSRKPGELFMPRGVYASEASREYLLARYRKNYPEEEYELRPEMRECGDGPPAFVRYAR